MRDFESCEKCGTKVALENLNIENMRNSTAKYESLNIYKSYKKNWVFNTNTLTRVFWKLYLLSLMQGENSIHD